MSYDRPLDLLMAFVLLLCGACALLISPLALVAWFRGALALIGVLTVALGLYELYRAVR